MEIINTIKKAADFGSFRSRENFFSFALKCVFYIVPAIILGNYTDLFIKKMKDNKILGNNTVIYILLQTFVVISILYIILIFLSDFTSEFQITIVGGYFIIIFFGLQTNYINMIKKVLG
jgi:hypothetical protein